MIIIYDSTITTPSKLIHAVAGVDGVVRCRVNEIEAQKDMNMIQKLTRNLYIKGNVLL